MPCLRLYTYTLRLHALWYVYANSAIMLTLTVHTGVHVAYARIVASMAMSAFGKVIRPRRMAMSAFGEVMRPRRTAMRTFDMAIRPRRTAMRTFDMAIRPRRMAMSAFGKVMRPCRTAMRECGLSEWGIRYVRSPRSTCGSLSLMLNPRLFRGRWRAAGTGHGKAPASTGPLASR